MKTAEDYIQNHPQYEHYLHYSFLVVNNQIITWGTNLDGSPPIHFGYNKRSAVPKLHSEYVVYCRGRKMVNLDKFELVNIRLNRSGTVKMAAPCEVCQGWLFGVGCSAVYFTTSNRWGKI
jgi:hypothetical protein